MSRRWGLPIALGLLILVLGGCAIAFAIESGNVSDEADRLRAESATLAAKAKAHVEDVDTANQALVDTAATDEVVATLRPVLEKVFSLNYTDLDATANAVKDNLTGKALCDYDLLFAQIKKLAPEQKLVITSRVREVGIARLEGDRLTALIFLDQTSTRVDQNQTAVSAAQFGVQAELSGDKWRIADFDFLGQPLPSAQSSPQC